MITSEARLLMRHRTPLLLLILWPAVAVWAAPTASHNTACRATRCTEMARCIARFLLTSNFSQMLLPPPQSMTVHGFALPADAAAAVSDIRRNINAFRSGIERRRPDSARRFRDDSASNSPWRHLPGFSFQFVQNGSHLIPVQQGLVITGNAAWNYIVGPGRVWQENSDNGYMRASLPFALVERNQNCVHNGEMTFLFNRTKNPNISRVRYQVTQETCLYFKLNMWGQLAATYTPATSQTMKRWKMRKLPRWQTAYPPNLSALWRQTIPIPGSTSANFTQGFKSPADITTYGLLINGVHYVSNCQTRYGTYPFCDDMRLPSYSIAKSWFAGMAMMWLGAAVRKLGLWPADSRLRPAVRGWRGLDEGDVQQHFRHGDGQLHQREF